MSPRHVHVQWEAIIAQRVQESIIGLDVSKNTLEMYVLASEQFCSINNDIKSIERWLDSCAGPLRLATEPTNSYHVAVASTGNNH